MLQPIWYFFLVLSIIGAKTVRFRMATRLVLCLRNNLLKKILCDRSLEGGVGVYFHFRHPKTSKPVTAPKEDNVRRTGTKNARRCGHMALWGCFIICINLVPFHDLWSDGGETENRPPCPQSRTIQSGQSNTSYFWDTTLSKAGISPTFEPGPRN